MELPPISYFASSASGFSLGEVILFTMVERLKDHAHLRLSDAAPPYHQLDHPIDSVKHRASGRLLRCEAHLHVELLSQVSGESDCYNA